MYSSRKSFFANYFNEPISLPVHFIPLLFMVCLQRSQAVGGGRSFAA